MKLAVTVNYMGKFYTEMGTCMPQSHCLSLLSLLDTGGLMFIILLFKMLNVLALST